MPRIIVFDLNETLLDVGGYDHCLPESSARPGKVLYPLGPAPDIVGPDLRAVAEQIAARDLPR